MATMRKSVRPISSGTTDPVTIVAPSGVMSNACSTSVDAASGRQVDRVGDALLPDRHRGGEEMPLARTVVRVPVTDRERVEQERLDARLLARLVALPVRCRIGGARKDGGRVDHHVGVAGGNDRVDAARRCGQQPSLAAVGRKQPQPADLLVVVAVIRRAVRIRPRRREQDRAVAGKRRGALARRRAREPARPLVPRRIELPQRAVHLLAVGRGATHRHDEASTVRRGAQPAEARETEVGIEVEGVAHPGIVAGFR